MPTPPIIDPRIKIGAAYPTREGGTAEVLATDLDGGWPVLVLIRRPDGSKISTVLTGKGREHSGTDRTHALDLILPKPEKIVRWFLADKGTGWDTQEEVENYAKRYNLTEERGHYIRFRRTSGRPIMSAGGEQEALAEELSHFRMPLRAQGFDVRDDSGEVMATATTFAHAKALAALANRAAIRARAALSPTQEDGQ